MKGDQPFLLTRQRGVAQKEKRERERLKDNNVYQTENLGNGTLKLCSEKRKFASSLKELRTIKMWKLCKPAAEDSYIGSVLDWNYM